MLIQSPLRASELLGEFGMSSYYAQIIGAHCLSFREKREKKKTMSSSSMQDEDGSGKARPGLAQPCPRSHIKRSLSKAEPQTSRDASRKVRRHLTIVPQPFNASRVVSCVCVCVFFLVTNRPLHSPQTAIKKSF